MNTIYIHTDGSSDNTKKNCGWAFCLSTREKSEVFHKDAGYNVGTNNVGELKGVLNSLHFVYGNHKPKKVVIFTDSKYVSDTVYFDYYGWYNEDYKYYDKQGKWVDRPNKALWIELKNLIHIMKMRGIEVDIRWKKGHAGDPLNELVDKLAVSARKSQQVNLLYE